MLSIFNKKQVHSTVAYNLDGLREIISPDVNFTYFKHNPDEDIVLFARLLIEPFLRHKGSGNKRKCKVSDSRKIG